MIKRNTILILVLFALIFSMAQVSAQQNVTFETRPNNIEVTKDQVFSVEVYITPNTMIDTVAADLLILDHELAQLTDGGISKGNLFSDQTIWIAGKEINNERGFAKYICWASTVPTDQAGTFFTLQLKALKDGSFSLFIDPEKAGAAYQGAAIPITVIGNPTRPVIPSEQVNTKESAGGLDGTTINILIGTTAAILFIVICYIFYKRRNIEKNEDIKSEDKNEKVAQVKPTQTIIKVKRYDN